MMRSTSTKNGGKLRNYLRVLPTGFRSCMRWKTAFLTSAPDFGAWHNLKCLFVATHRPESERFAAHGNGFAAHDDGNRFRIGSGG